MTKWIIGVGILVIAVVALAWGGVFSSLMPKTAVAPTPQPATTTQQQPAPAAPAPVNDLPTATTDASDAALAQDTAAVDVQLQSLGSDSASIDAALNDKAVTQEF